MRLQLLIVLNMNFNLLTDYFGRFLARRGAMQFLGDIITIVSLNGLCTDDMHGVTTIREQWNLVLLLPNLHYNKVGAHCLRMVFLDTASLNFKFGRSSICGCTAEKVRGSVLLYSPSRDMPGLPRIAKKHAIGFVVQ
jgi:hypothetical protein